MKFLKNLYKVSKNYIPAFIWLLLIFYLLFLFEPSGNGVKIPFLDKFVHFILFCVLTILTCYGLFKDYTFKKKKNVFFVLFTIVIFLALITELVQFLFINGRSGDINDAFADLVGAFLGYQIYVLLIKKSPYFFKKYLLKN